MSDAPAFSDTEMLDWIEREMASGVIGRWVYLANKIHKGEHLREAITTAMLKERESR